jgi:hypothetical protein
LAFARTRETRTLALILIAVVGPLLLTGALIAIDMRTDLSDLKAIRGKSVDGYPAFGWADLANMIPGHPTPARMLGYMMDGYHPVSDETPVMMFTLMPDAGHILHPAHRVPDEMVEVWLPLDMPIRYLNRRLVWVSGTLRRKDAAMKEGEALYTISNATVRFAAEHQIRDWFAP